MSLKTNILVADDEELIRRVLAEALVAEGYEVETAADGEIAWKVIQRHTFDLAFLDIRMPGLNGLEVLQKIKDLEVALPVIIMTGQTTLTNAIESMKSGAFDYLPKPFDLEDVRILAGRALEASRLAANIKQTRPAIAGKNEQIIGSGPSMQQVYKTIGRIVSSDATVLIQGESGTGKELVAKVLHHYSSRWRGPFVPINCSAIPLELLESELFGHEKGAFTGATERHNGKFEQANGGTLFLDEIADMPLPLQAKLLRVFQEREFTRVGGSQLQRTDVRIIAASNQDLAVAVEEDRFREDLYFRVKVVPITLPPLRERPEDIPELTRHFLSKIAITMGTTAKGVTSEAQSLLSSYPWPGNVRELENALVSAAVLSPSPELTPSDLSLGKVPVSTHSDVAESPLGDTLKRQLPSYLHNQFQSNENNLYARVIALVEEPLIELILEHTAGNQVKAAKILGINRNTLRKKMTALKITGKH